ncbi:MAG: hypothetical protein DWQ37_09810 [Planctomycetota bacterium]|nr:MAG: hypothetical protein DWQ37_09810 [Planctomycetota bacterium]
MPSSDPPIRLAFLGADENTAALAGHALAEGAFELRGLWDAPRSLDPPLAAVADRMGVYPGSAWETLLDDDRIDAVVVARGPDEDLRAEQLRKFAQTGRPVLVSHPVVTSMLIYYELDMIRAETGAVMVPLLGMRSHPAVRTLAEIVSQGDSSPVGRIEQLSFERFAAADDKAQVQRLFARDVDLVRSIAGDMTRLGAMSAGGGASQYANLGVQMTGPADIAARWAIVPPHGASGARISLSGTGGRVLLDAPDDGSPWTLEFAGDPDAGREYPPVDEPAEALRLLAEAGRGEPPKPDWVDACRSVELAETIERSLNKNRTIELYYEDYTEDATFKGTMTSIGCGLLVFTLVLLALVGIAEQMRIPFVGAWKYVMVAVFGVFLLVQLVMFTSGKRREESRPVEPSAD